MNKTDSFRKAQALVLTALRHNGPIKSHVLTDMCLRAVLIEPRQFGALFTSMSLRGLIEKYSTYKRSNGQLDGVVWIASKYPRLLDQIIVNVSCSRYQSSSIFINNRGAHEKNEV